MTFTLEIFWPLALASGPGSYRANYTLKPLEVEGRQGEALEVTAVSVLHMATRDFTEVTILNDYGEDETPITFRENSGSIPAKFLEIIEHSRSFKTND